ncbi:alpha/beta fold hydrolase [Nocardia huaxiensis]|uniref:Alpha/beta hydrolase n=1 Tax=Nocardia huaxiensis TaxID=2755382 RepID=A0A7D6V8F4_9NOCA|nr:alpha/beta hydrolase [Nocardia huaxiensis]QLY30272.1 alpha/beta hydrolase [Nocardia huaxiensis]UFS96103.1 alpha/beta hydrolase [Nocardia huaxiensis]
MPTLVLSGDRDPLLPIEAMSEFGSHATDLQVQLLDGVGHFPDAGDPERVLECAVRFLG